MSLQRHNRIETIRFESNCLIQSIKIAPVLRFAGLLEDFELKRLVEEAAAKSLRKSAEMRILNCYSVSGQLTNKGRPVLSVGKITETIFGTYC